jgi:capsule biosynthesis phosphatase
MDVIQRLRDYKILGKEIIIYTSRNMRTYRGDIKKIEKFTLPLIIEWLHQHDVPYDSVMIGKPWCGFDGFYVDDRAIRPSEFASMSPEEVGALLSNEQL